MDDVLPQEAKHRACLAFDNFRYEEWKKRWFEVCGNVLAHMAQVTNSLRSQVLSCPDSVVLALGKPKHASLTETVYSMDFLKAKNLSESCEVTLSHFSRLTNQHVSKEICLLKLKHIIL
ncbi:MAG: hypothetical protein ACI9VM_000631 [Candidatus Azotimanducaceae bacterium]|jgi:hypothetical protein